MDDAKSRPGVSSPALALSEITLVNFRSYASATLKPGPGPVVLAGANGTGKTNCLEAISLLSPGRGLRGAKLAAIQRKAPAEASSDGSLQLWAVSATVARPDGAWEIGTGLLPANGSSQPRRVLRSE